MSARSERDTLNSLIEICRDGTRGFGLAADQVSDSGLKRIFSDTALQRERFVSELVPLAQRLGGEDDADGTAKGALHRGWMRVKDAIAKYDDGMVLTEAIRGEAHAADAYADALMSFLPPDARPVIERQYNAIRDVLLDLEEITLPCA
jgi:uncharacterized protein (TIGR02284 family)